MKGFLIAVGCLVLVVSIFFAWMSWGFLNRNKQIVKELSHSSGIPVELDKHNFGNPSAGLIVSLLGILLGALLIIANL